MRKKHIIAVALLLALLLCGFAAREWTERQTTAHQIAELARSMGLPESDPIIVRAQELWWEDEPQETVPQETVPEDELPTPWYTQQDIDIIASVVYNEAGVGTTERHKELVAAVLVNRVLSDKFPNTVYECVVQPLQYYAPYAQYGSYYMNRAMQSDIWTYCCEIAERALKGEVECPENVLYQANFAQGYGVYEYGYTSYSTTYFCYG